MPLNPDDRQRLLDFYQTALTEFGSDNAARSVRWSRDEDQQTRFNVLLQVGDVVGHSVLDVGCGMGELYRFLLRNEIETDYHGIDLVPEFIDQARNSFPEADFSVGDIFDLFQPSDFVLASGALSFKVADNDDYYRQMITKMYGLATEAVAFNMLLQDVHVDNEIYATYDPVEVADWCSALAERVEVMDGYLPQDFTVFLYK